MMIICDGPDCSLVALTTSVSISLTLVIQKAAKQVQHPMKEVIIDSHSRSAIVLVFVLFFCRSCLAFQGTLSRHHPYYSSSLSSSSSRHRPSELLEQQQNNLVERFRNGIVSSRGKFHSSTLTMTMTSNNVKDTSEGSSSSTGNLVLSLANSIGTDVTLILASQSPRRREILDMMGLSGKYMVEPSPLDESKLQGSLQEQVRTKVITSLDYTRQLAEAKPYALAAEHLSTINSSSDSTTAPTLYLGSDTIVDLDGTILEKPKDADDAKIMLRQLSGRTHYVHTGVAIYSTGTTSTTTNIDDSSSVPNLVLSFTDTAKVTFTDLSDIDIDAYIKSGEPMDKAGSYGIQGIGGQFVQEVSGDFFTVMGLPMHRTSRALVDAIKQFTKQSE